MKVLSRFDIMAYKKSAWRFTLPMLLIMPYTEELRNLTKQQICMYVCIKIYTIITTKLNTACLYHEVVVCFRHQLEDTVPSDFEDDVRSHFEEVQEWRLAHHMNISAASDRLYPPPPFGSVVIQVGRETVWKSNCKNSFAHQLSDQWMILFELLDHFSSLLLW